MAGNLQLSVRTRSTCKKIQCGRTLRDSSVWRVTTRAVSSTRVSQTTRARV